MHRFIPAIVASQGYRIGEIQVAHHPRRHGKSKYGFLRLFKGFFDLGTVLLLTRFEDRPAHGFGFAGLGMFVLGLFSALLLGPAAALDRVPSSMPIVSVAACWVGSVILLAAGWVAEIVLANGSPADNLPYYSIEEQLD
jgi:dolichol-phosphate mannosyltransferase